MMEDAGVLSRGRRRLQVWRRQSVAPTLKDPSSVLCLVILGLTFALGVGMIMWPTTIPAVPLAVLVVIAGLYLSLRHAVICMALALIWLVAGFLLNGPTEREVIIVACVLAITAMMLSLARSRARLGTVGVGGETMLVDLRDRIAGSGEIPTLPQRWQAQTAIRSAHGDGFSGDFLVSTLSQNGHRLEVALVDVSGKGREAGTRALLLSGGMSGIIGSVAAEAFLPAANHYLLRQNWAEGFATAVHLDLDLRTGEYSLGRAGHPAPAQFLVGSGTWRLVGGGRGPLLGVMEGIDYPRVTGRLAHGDALLLYSDGVIESRDYDLSDGVDRMLGVATRVMVDGGHDLADHVCRVARAGAEDDRAAVAILHR